MNPGSGKLESVCMGSKFPKKREQFENRPKDGFTHTHVQSLPLTEREIESVCVCVCVFL